MSFQVTIHPLQEKPLENLSRQYTKPKGQSEIYMSSHDKVIGTRPAFPLQTTGNLYLKQLFLDIEQKLVKAYDPWK